MKIGIVADSHDNVPAIKKAVEYFNKSSIAILDTETCVAEIIDFSIS